MDTDHVNSLFEALQSACQTQHGFQPGRVSENMHYMQEIKPGVHRFRDTLCHAEIRLSLNPPNAVLHERSKKNVDWTPTLINDYRKTDEQIRAALDDQDAKEAYVQNSALWQTHGAYIRSLYRDDPTYVESDVTPIAGALALVYKLLASADGDLLDVSKRVSSINPNALAHWLISPYSREKRAQMWTIVFADPRFEALKEMAPQLLAEQRNDSAEKAAKALAEGIIDDLPRHLRGLQSRYIFIDMLIRKAVFPE
jgi:hypothetical protein